MGTYPTKELFDKVDKRAGELYDELAELTGLLKRCRWLEGPEGKGYLYWSPGDMCWCLRKPEALGIIDSRPTLLDALRVLVGKE